MHWCWAGLATVILLGIPLAEARDLFSPDEILLEFSLGRWIAIEDFGVEDVAWKFQITPVSAWWGIALGGLACSVGWSARRSDVALPFGWMGALTWLTALGQLFAENLLVLFLMSSTQALLCGAWLARQTSGGEGSRSYLYSLLVGDTFGLWGVLLAGLAWGSYSLSAFGAVDWNQEASRSQLALGGVAGTCLFLGGLGRGALFPFLAGTRSVAQGTGPAGALLFSVCLWPALGWFLFRIQPILAGAPQTVALVQGVSLLAAVAAAFVATGQGDNRRLIGLLATSQIAFLLSVLTVPDAMPVRWLSLLIGVLALSTAVLFLAPSTLMPRLAQALAWWMLIGGALSPAFCLSVQAADQFQRWPMDDVAKAEGTAAGPLDALESSAEKPPRIVPLPVPQWVAAWCLWSFFAAFAGWRGWRTAKWELGTAARGGGGASGSELPRSAARRPSAALVLLLSIVLLAAAAYAAVLVVPIVGDVSAWPAGAATAAFAAGWLTAVWVCRDPERIEENFNRLGSWARLARRDLFWDEWLSPVRQRYFVPAVTIAHDAEEILVPGLRRRWIEGLVLPVVDAVQELRREPAVFYSIALTLTIGSLVVTWLSLSG